MDLEFSLPHQFNEMQCQFLHRSFDRRRTGTLQWMRTLHIFRRCRSVLKQYFRLHRKQSRTPNGGKPDLCCFRIVDVTSHEFLKHHVIHSVAPHSPPFLLPGPSQSPNIHLYLHLPLLTYSLHFRFPICWKRVSEVQGVHSQIPQRIHSALEILLVYRKTNGMGYFLWIVFYIFLFLDVTLFIKSVSM